MRSLRFDGESDDAFRQRAERAARIARVLVGACLTNHDVREMVEDPSPPYTKDELRRAPIVRIEYDQAFAVGRIGECLAATRNKYWGDGPWVMLFQPDDPVSPDRILYVYKPDSLYNRRFEQRRRLKELLGKTRRPLVGKAMALCKREFLANIAKGDARAVRHLVGIEPGELWQAVRGKLFLTLPPRIVQLELHFGE